MQGSEALLRRAAWSSPGTGSLYSRIPFRQPSTRPITAPRGTGDNVCSWGGFCGARNASSVRQLRPRPPPTIASRQLTQPPPTTATARVGLLDDVRSRSFIARAFSASRTLSDARSGNSSPAHRDTERISALDAQRERDEGDDEAPRPARERLRALGEEEDDEGFARSEKASQAAHVNLSARLSKDGSGGHSQSSGFDEVWRLIKVARPEARTLLLACAFLLVSSTITMSIPFSIGKILDIAVKAHGDGAGAHGDEAASEGGRDAIADATKATLFGLDMTTFYAALAGVLFVGATANYGRIVLLRIVGERIVTRLRSRLYRRTLIQNAEFFDANRVGDLISRLGSDTVIVGKSITQNLSDGLRSFISGAAGLTLMAYVSTKLTGILALMFPPLALGAFFYGRAIRNLSRRIQKSLGSLTKIAEERLGNVRTAQAFAGEVQEVGRYNAQVKQIFALGKREALISATFFSASGLMGNLTILALLYVGGGMVSSGAISIGELSSFLMYTAYAGSSMFGLSAFYSELMKGVGAASRLFELADREPSKHPTVGLPVRSAKGPIVFDKVAFAYPTRPAVRIFSDLTFSIAQGSNVAIVAPSGAGKSTVASLLLRFYTPDQGTIRIGGVSVVDMNAKQLRRRIGYVGQEPVLFSGTIAENIKYGCPWATRAEVVSAARRANCGFIGDFPEGLETHVGARGTQLSGGQKQRIAIARALLKNPDILILDEATSALDAESETAVNAALASLLRDKDKTTISIAHRLSTIKRADRVVVIGADGRVAEEGGFEELSRRKDGAFARLMEWQLSGGEAAERIEVERSRGERMPTVSEREEIEFELEAEEAEEEAERELEEEKEREKGGR
ncbi:hypothetical protein BDY21DRAFT_116292 [Lineolata rhizophorae]|uniref:P-loop containing nucleoside triphosphate hydrolase protein n=1 Tax=Lineolata rhizophorae TaxID=578093 RepID=A0A6A6NQJ5_9PEZI|nr:hypothetical protein BDY21DRAFT_116292 [Lineolata rhizophorae]